MSQVDSIVVTIVTTLCSCAIAFAALSRNLSLLSASITLPFCHVLRLTKVY